MAKRGRPFGHKLSEESKQKISISKSGQVHTKRTKRKISKSLRKYFKTPAGQKQRELTGLYLSSYWNSEEGLYFREALGESLSRYYNENFKN